MQDDYSLWEVFLKGDKASFEEIYATYYRNLYEYGMRKLDDEELVKDCLQDLFINLWVKRRNLGPTSNIKYYLMAALKNGLINAGLRQEKRKYVEIGDAAPFILDFPNELRPGVPEGDTIRLTDALNQLTSRQKEVIYLRYFEELSYEQIAELMDISVKGIYKLNYRALDALKEILGMSRKDLLLLLAVCKLALLK